MGRTRTPRIRRDGWTPERQLRFLHALTRAHSVTRAAAFAGMSRESAYRLRARAEGALFGVLWDRALAPVFESESHIRPLTDGWLLRLLGNHYRRQTNGFWPKRSTGRECSET